MVVERPTGDQGSATVTAAVASMALLSVLWLGIEVGFAAISRHRAEGAADLAALAAAAHASQEQEFACGRANWLVEAMRATLVSCRLDGWDARVEVRVVPPGFLSSVGSADARARAGPAPP